MVLNVHPVTPQGRHIARAVEVLRSGGVIIYPTDTVYGIGCSVFDTAAIERLFAEHGARIAGIVTEIPTNPLVQTPDVPHLTALVRKHGAMLLLDPSVNSAFNLDVLPHALELLADVPTEH